MSEWNHGWSLWWEYWRQESTELRLRIRTQGPCTWKDSIWENAVTSLSIMDVFSSRGSMKARQIWRSWLRLDSCCCAPTLTEINARRKRVYLVYASTSHLITEGSQRRDLKAALSVLGTNSQPRKYSRTHRVLASRRLTCRLTYS